MSGIAVGEEAAATVLAWGLWLLPSQRVSLPHQQTRTFYVTLGVLLLTGAAELAGRVPPASAVQVWTSFGGGVIWAASGWAAFVGATRLGMARAFGIWAPLNVVVSLLWGRVLFGEFSHAPALEWLAIVAAVAAMSVGIGFIVSAQGGEKAAGGSRRWVGYLGAGGAGVGFASYFLPAQLTQLSARAAMLPIAAGMFAGGAALALGSRAQLRLARRGDYPRLMATGWLWALGNYCALLMMARLGTGRGFAVAQLCVVVNALAGIVVLRDPEPGTSGASRMLLGVVIATAAGIALGLMPSP